MIISIDKEKKPGMEPILLNTWSETSKEGYIRLYQQVNVHVGTRSYRDDRYFSYQGTLETLSRYVAFFNEHKELPGRIRVEEYLLSQVPELLAHEYLKPHLYTTGNKFKSDKTQEERIYMHAKKPFYTKGAPMCTHKGEIIMRFHIWDMTGELPDKFFEGDIDGQCHSIPTKNESSSVQFRMQQIRKI
jgi:hypothetical protein